MTRRLARATLIGSLLLTLAWLAPRPARAGAGPDTLADSTWVDRWKLKNGLEVTVRHVPRSNAVAVITAYRIGRDQDPKDRAGMADLLCEVLYTAAAGNVPERSRDQMGDLRPLGWNLQVTPRFSLLSEVATVEQFPGVLTQVATRLRGVTVEDSVLVQARRTTTRDMAERYMGTPERTLVNEIRDLALGVSDEELIRRVSGRTLQSVTVKEVSERLRRLYVPANTVLALAGNLDGIDVRALVAKLFEGIPGGTAQPEPPSPRLTGARRVIQRSGLTAPMGGVGIVAPPITDPSHPDFYLSTLIIGQFCRDFWGTTPELLAQRFRYPVFGDAQIAQFFPSVPDGMTDPDQLSIMLQTAVEKLSLTLIGPETVDELRTNQRWLFGGAMTPAFLQRARVHAGTLHTLASTLAVQALWGSRDFWARYLDEFDNMAITDIRHWTNYYGEPDHSVRLLITPRKP